MPLYTESHNWPHVERYLRNIGQERRFLGESLRHQRAAATEVAVFNWFRKADEFVFANTGLDAADDDAGPAYYHAVAVLAGLYRERVEAALSEAEREFLATREAGQR